MIVVQLLGGWFADEFVWEEEREMVVVLYLWWGGAEAVAGRWKAEDGLKKVG